MGAVEIDVRPGRLLVVTVEGHLDGTQIRSYLAGLGDLVDDGRPFAMLTVYPGSRPRKDAEGHRLEKEWLAAHRAQLRGVLVAVALVHNAGPVRRAIERVAMTGAGRRMFGCPCRPFAELDEAARWASDLVDAATPR